MRLIEITQCDRYSSKHLENSNYDVGKHFQLQQSKLKILDDFTLKGHPSVFVAKVIESA